MSFYNRIILVIKPNAFPLISRTLLVKYSTVKLNQSDPLRSYFSKFNRLDTALAATATQTFSLGSATDCLIKDDANLFGRLGRMIKIYADLSKAKLSGLVVSTTLAGFLMGPLPESFGMLSMLSSPTFWATIGGTALCAASANSFNQWAEASFDARMARTRLRPLPTQKLSFRHAFAWATGSAISGLGILWAGAGPLATGLSALTIGLYTLVYTPLKRRSVVNTWVGAVVGAIPPMIGYAGAMSLTPFLTASTSAFFPEAYLLGAVLYCWQFPHFNALSHNLRHDYQRAGYCMAAIQRPKLNRWAALTHSIAMIPITLVFPLLTDMTTGWVALDGSVLNLALTWLAFKFAWDPSRKTAKELFLFSLLYLPLFLILLVVHRKQHSVECQKKEADPEVYRGNSSTAWETIPS